MNKDNYIKVELRYNDKKFGRKMLFEAKETADVLLTVSNIFTAWGEAIKRIIEGQTVDNVEYIPEFLPGCIVTLKSNPGGTLFKVRRNFGMYSEVQKIERSYLEKASDMTFYVQRISLVEYKGRRSNKWLSDMVTNGKIGDNAVTTYKEKKNV